jgi:hypothetical protein
MSRSAWNRLAATLPGAAPAPWLPELLARNAHTEYLRQYNSPRDQAAFLAALPIVGYDDLEPWLASIRDGRSDVLFAGRPVAYERTGGSTRGAKLIPYSSQGLDDFRRALLPWLVESARRHRVSGRVYLSISPATRQPECIGDVPVGLGDGAYLGDVAAILAELSAVPFEVGAIADIGRWRAETVRHLTAAADLELISCWSPTFLLLLLEDIPDPARVWPRLKILSCWASAASKPFALELAARLPQAHLQAKGLISTECVVSVPGAGDHPLLTPHGFFEFERAGELFLEAELEQGGTYGVIVTTASGLYRYRTGDLVRCTAHSGRGQPILEFVGRDELASDLVGEKLTESFVAECLTGIPGFHILVPTALGDGYALATESCADVGQVEQRLCRNPQYAFARRLGQLQSVRLVQVDRLLDRYIDAQLRRGVRLGDIKPLALRSERGWLEALGVAE